jgi:hypothetical protein
MFKLSSDILSNFRGVQSALELIKGWIEDVRRRFGPIEERLDTLESRSGGGVTLPIDAEDVDYDNGASGLTATDVQAAIDEIAASGGGGGESYDPVTNYCDFDDFDYQPVTEGDVFDSRRSSLYGNTADTQCVNGLPSAVGVWRLVPYTSYVQVRSHRGHSTPNFSLWLDSNPLTVEYRFKINMLADATYKEYVLCGLADVNGWNGFARVVYWPDGLGTGHFYLHTKEGGVESSVQMTTQPVAGVWYTVKIVATLSSVSAYVKTTGDFTLEATSTSNIPDSARTMATVFQVGSTSTNLTSSHYVDLDYRRVTKTLDR